MLANRKVKIVQMATCRPSWTLPPINYCCVFARLHPGVHLDDDVHHSRANYLMTVSIAVVHANTPLQPSILSVCYLIVWIVNKDQGTVCNTHRHILIFFVFRFTNLYGPRHWTNNLSKAIIISCFSFNDYDDDDDGQRSRETDVHFIYPFICKCLVPRMSIPIYIANNWAMTL